MFLQEHEIWKFAFAGDELDDWLPYAEGLVDKWLIQRSDEVVFATSFEVVIAALLLKDNLLPSSAKAAFAELMLNVMDEAKHNKLKIECLHIYPPKPGRKEDRRKTFMVVHEVKALIQNGVTATEAYETVAEARFKSPDTIRREFERAKKKRKHTGRNDG